MEEKEQFQQLLKPVRRQLLIQKGTAEIQYWMLASAVYTVVLFILARWFVFPFYLEFVWSGCFLLLVIYLVRAWRKRPTTLDSAKLYNSYVPDDRVLTAVSFIHQDGLLQTLQLKETIVYMKRKHQVVLGRKKGYLKPKVFVIAVLFVCIAILLTVFPNKTQVLADKRESEIKVMKKVEKKAAKLANSKKEKEVKKALEKAKEAIKKNPDPQKALEQLAKAKKELDLKALKEQEKRDRLNGLQQELQKNQLNSLAAALKEKDLAKIKKELDKLNKKHDSLTDAQKKALSKMTGTEKQLSDKELAELSKKINEALDAAQNLKDLAAAEGAIDEIANSLEQELTAKGLPTNQTVTSGNQAAANNNNPASANPNGKPQASPAGSGNGQQSSGNSQGNASGNGNGSGNSSGNGQGSGSGTGGSGSGAGLGTGSRQLLTIPDKVDGKTNLETDNGSVSSGSPAEQYVGDGPVLPGQLRPYQEVYGEYAEAYRNSTDRVKLPADLEKIVKDYYILLDPNKE